MAKGKLPEMLKNADVTMSDCVDIGSTRMLDGEASNPTFLTESNKTEQYKTPSIPKGDLGGRNNLDG
jgi:hypothetical protein